MRAAISFRIINTQNVLTTALFALATFSICGYLFDKNSYRFSLTNKGKDASFLVSTAKSMEYSP